VGLVEKSRLQRRKGLRGVLLKEKLVLATEQGGVKKKVTYRLHHQLYQALELSVEITNI